MGPLCGNNILSLSRLCVFKFVINVSKRFKLNRSVWLDFILMIPRVRFSVKMSAHCSINTSIYFTQSEIMNQKHTPATQIIISYIMPITAILGVLFNVAFLFVIYRVPKMRTVTNLYLTQLSVCDNGYLVVTTTRLMRDYFLSPEYDFEQPTSTGCHTFDFLIYFFYFSGVHFICAVITDRYFAICRPMQYRSFSGFRARNVSVVCWVIGFVLAMAGLVPMKETTICTTIQTKAQNESQGIVLQVCQPSCTWCYQMLLVFDTVQFIIALLINVILCSSIIGRLRERSRKTVSSNADSIMQTVSRNVTRMLNVNGIMFFVLLGPYEIWNVVFLINDYTEISMASERFLFWLKWFARVFVSINSTVNPLIYSATNQQYRQAFMDIFGRLLFKKQMRTEASYISEGIQTKVSNTSQNLCDDLSDGCIGRPNHTWNFDTSL